MMRAYSVTFGNGTADKVTRSVYARSTSAALRQAFKEYEQIRKEQGGRTVRKSLSGEGIRIFIRYI